MSLFYETIGPLLGRAADALEGADLPAPPDERRQRELRQIRTLLRRIRAIWPDMFHALAEETAILEATLRAAISQANAHGLDPEGEGAAAGPLDRYRGLLGALDAMVILLQEHAEEVWAQDAMRSIRRGLADAAEVQGRLVDDMLRA